MFKLLCYLGWRKCTIFQVQTFSLAADLHSTAVSVLSWLRSSLLSVTRWLNFSSTFPRITREENSEHVDGVSSKRKFSEQLKGAELEEEEREEGGKEVKRWRGDTIFIAVQDFIAKMWGGAAVIEDDSTELENMDNVDEKFWKQQPQFDFLPNEVEVKFGEKQTLEGH